MSIESAQAFYEAIDKWYVTNLVLLSNMSHEFIALAKAQGYDFTGEEMEEILLAQEENR